MENLIVWLKSTVWGIVILGACGSGLFAFAFYLAKRLFIHWFPNFRIFIINYLYRWIARMAISHQEFMDNKNPYNLLIYLFYNLMIFIFFLFVSAVSLLRFWSVIISEKQSLLSINTLLPIMTLFIGLVGAFYKFINVYIPYICEVEAIIKYASKEARICQNEMAIKNKKS
jgi:hypothetical protein